MARPRKEIDWAAVDKLCALQATCEEIAQFIGVSSDTLDRACKREYRIGYAEYFDQKRGAGKISLRRSQWQAAQSGNPTMLIWLGKQYLGQKDKSAYEHSGPDGNPIEITPVSKLPDEVLDAKISALIQKTKGLVHDA
jgi:hypothetical protein